MKLSSKSLLYVILIMSLILNVKCTDSQNALKYVTFADANTHETYETIHHVKDAQKISTGKGIKVGVLDKYFGFKKHSNFYSGGENFTRDNEAFEEIDEHGYWMATTLKEIAPDVKVFALNVRSNNRDEESQSITEAINWAIENHIDILTYSAESFSPKNSEKIDLAVKKAIEHGIVTTFINYPLPENIFPWGLFAYKENQNSREPDLRIYHFDFNSLLLSVYNKYLESGRKPRNGDDMPFLSLSSMSPVLAGFVAMLKEVKRDLPPDEYKQILITTSKEIDYKGRKIERVVDIKKALEYLTQKEPIKK